MFRPYVSDIPARKDLSFRTNSDQTVGVVWLASDGTTPVPVASAFLTLEFDVKPPELEDPDPVPVRSEIAADPDGLAAGQLLFTVAIDVWPGIVERSGNWDVVADSTVGVHRCLVRGIFTVEEGVGTGGVG